MVDGDRGEDIFMKWETISKSKFAKFHKIFKGDSEDIFKICFKCGGICEYSFIGTLLPGEPEYIASKMGISLKEFKDRYLDGIDCNGVVMDVLKMVNPCPFINKKTMSCSCREFKVIYCDIYPISIGTRGAKISYSIDDCPLGKNKKFRSYFLTKGIQAIEMLDIPVTWVNVVLLYDNVSVDYDIFEKIRKTPNYEVFKLETILKYKRVRLWRTD